MNMECSAQSNQMLTSVDIEILADLILEESDHYTVLGVNRAASVSQIHESYSLAINSFHPSIRADITGSNPVMQWKLSQVMKRINDAYSTLSNERRRKVYDDMRNFRFESDDLIESSHDVSMLYVESKCRYIQSKHMAAGLKLPVNKTKLDQSNEPHSIGSGDERRRVERASLRLPVLVRCDQINWQEFAESRDVSPLGIRFSASRRVEPGTTLKIELPMPKDLRIRSYGEKLYQVDGIVIRSVEDKMDYVVAAEFLF